MKDKQQMAGSALLSITLHACALAVLCAYPSAVERRLTSSAAKHGTDHSGSDSLIVTVSMGPEPESERQEASITRPFVPEERYVEPVLEPHPHDRPVDQYDESFADAHRFTDTGSLPFPSSPSPAIAPSANLTSDSFHVVEFPLPIVQTDGLPQRNRQHVSLMKPLSDPNPDFEPSVGQFRAAPISQSLAVRGTAQNLPADMSDNQSPEYPPDAVRRRQQGMVLLKLRIDVDGRVAEVQILSSSGHSSLDEAAVSAVRKWRGRPATRFGAAVPSEEVLPVRFRL